MSFTVRIIVANGGHFEGTTGGHIGDFSWHQNKERENFIIPAIVNVSAFIFISVTPLYSSDGPLNMAAVDFSFPKIDAQTSPIFEISGPMKVVTTTSL